VYRESAPVYDALSRHKDYAGACSQLVETIQHHLPNARTLLDVGCGTGVHLSHLRHRFEVEGLDASADMLAVARTRCPGVPLHEASFSDFDLGKRFDVVTCLFGSIAYAGDVAALGRSVACLARHLRSDGLLVLEPYVAPDRYITGRLVFDWADGDDLKVARMYVTERRGDIAVLDSTYVVGDASGIRSFQEKQELGLFAADDYRRAFHDAGLALLDESGSLFGYGLYVCRTARSSNG
jgi:SAM-dependent methyltransferase